jgi:UDP-N-acetylmuramyl tripeptide synthase
MVSGTNGKTSTTAFLAASLRMRLPVVTNSAGANMPAGIAATLATGRAGATAVLEADESHLPRLIDELAPKLVVLTNLSRDQLDRVGEVTMVAERWRSSLARHDHLCVVANADDPQVAWAAAAAPRVVWVGAGQTWHADSVTCLACGELLERSGEKWWCDACGAARPTPSWEWEEIPDGMLVRGPSGTAQVTMHVPGRVNRDNALLAVAAAVELGVPLGEAAEAVRAVHSVAHRYAYETIQGQRVRLLLGKNPAGWCALLDLLASSSAPVVVAVNCRVADGRDASWLWDVPFERLRGHMVIATGERRADLAVRLLQAGVNHITTEDPWSWLHENGHNGLTTVDVVATYTAFMDLARQAHAP